MLDFVESFEIVNKTENNCFLIFKSSLTYSIILIIKTAIHEINILYFKNVLVNFCTLVFRVINVVAKSK